MKVTYIILHYLAFEMTVKSCDYILKKVTGDKNIVIVDNASPNQSGEKLKQYYFKNDNVYVLSAKKNLGFARGNNLGYHFAKENLEQDYIVIMNNDVLIEDSNFQKKIEEIYNRTNFDVLGPDILTASGLHQNPYRIGKVSEEHVKKIIRSAQNKIAHYGLYNFIDQMRKMLSSIKRKCFPFLYSTFYEKECLNPTLHGACFICSGKFINCRFNAFNENTFLYMEEEILRYECVELLHMNFFYSPELYVTHLEDVSTNQKEPNKKNRELCRLGYVLESAQYYLSLIKNNPADLMRKSIE